MSFTPFEKLGEYLSNFIDFVYNNIETMYGAEHDNEHEPITIPSNIYYSCYGLYYANLTGVDFSASWWHGGNWSIIYSFDVTFANGDLRYGGFAELGRYNKTDWDAIDTIPEYGVSPDAAYNILHGYIESNEQMYVYSSEPESTPYTYTATIDSVYNCPKFMFAKNNNYGAVYSKYQGGDGQLPDISPTGTLFSAQYINLYFWPFNFIDEGDGYIRADTGLNAIPTSYLWSRYGDGLLLTKTNDTSVINNYVTNNGAEHNYTYTYETEHGDEVTVYYGDNYVIYKCDDDAQITYDDNYNIINKIKEDTDVPVDNPTYHDKKYGPPVDPDDDIEVDMPLNDAAFGTGLSHYYVTTVDAPVLNDISEAMSSWNITNTGKDLYRNLLSCRITKVGPIPAENSTFVIYGEELQYNGSPISINKITGNPSMDLGEYEILPKFNDFRDYAPYTKIEMFIPYCGWVALPSHVMSSEEKPKIITGTLLCDIIAGTCKAVIKCNDTVVAEASGFTAVDVPFTGENVGMKMAGIASAITSYGNSSAKTVGNIASGGLSGGAGAGAAAAGGLVGLLGSYAQMYSAFNANYTEICGKTGDGCNVAGLNKVYIKIQRPKTGGYSEPDFVPEDYGHTTGFIAMKKGQISKCEGLIVCSNPDTSGIGGATDREKKMIKNLLESGIIVRHTEPEP